MGVLGSTGLSLWPPWPGDVLLEGKRSYKEQTSPPSCWLKYQKKKKKRKNCPEMPRLSNSTVVDRESSLKGIEYKENDTRRLTERQAVELGEQTDRQKKQGGQ